MALLTNYDSTVRYAGYSFTSTGKFAPTSDGVTAFAPAVVLHTSAGVEINPAAPVLAAGENFVGAVGGKTVIAGGTITRPTDTNAYALGDLVANSVTAGSVTPITVAAGRVTNGTGMIRRVRLKKSTTSTTNASFRVHFYKDTPTVTNGDNGAWLSTESNYLGSADVTMDKAFSDAAKGLGSPNTGSDINFDCSSGTANIFALIEARAAYSPGNAEVFTLACEVLQN